MLDLKWVVANLDEARKRLSSRGEGAAKALEPIEALAGERRQLILASETRRADQKKASEQMRALKGDEQAQLRARLKALRNATWADSLTVEPIRPESISEDSRLSSRSDTTLADDLSAKDSIPEHPRLLARQAAIAAAEQAVRVEQLGGRPDFTIMSRYGARPLGSDFFSAFVGLRIPLYAGRKQHRLADAARADADAARAALAGEQAELREEIRTALAQIQGEVVRLRLLTAQVVPASQATVDATLRSYRVGRIEFLTVLAAEDALYRARLDAARVAADHLTHLVMLEQLVTPEGDS